MTGQRSTFLPGLLAGVLLLTSCAASAGASQPAVSDSVNTPAAVASASSDAVAADTVQGSDGGTSFNLGPCPSDLESIIKAQGTGTVRPLTSLDGTPSALLTAFPSAPVCAVDVVEVDRVGRYLFWQDGNIDGMASALNAAGYIGDLDPGNPGERFAIFKAGSKQVFLTDQFGGGGTALPTGSYMVAYRSE